MNSAVSVDAQMARTRRLMWAVLSDAVAVLHTAVRRGRVTPVYRETVAWVEDDDRTWVFSFASVCDALGLDPAWVRARLRRWMR